MALVVVGASDLVRQIRREFHEMPGLRLTVLQAARLFNLEPGHCDRVLGDLVRNGVLRRARDGSYMRADRPAGYPD